MTTIGAPLLGILTLLSLLAKPAFAETWRIVTLDWPPYTDQKLPGKGVAAQALSEALKTVGVEVEYVFMPWSRGVYEAQKPGYVGIFPTWRADIFKNAKLSPMLFVSPIGFAHHKETPHPWKTLQDLKGLQIGTVRDYDYPEELKTLGKKGVYRLLDETSDEQNLFKVAYKRLDLTVVDLANAKYLIETRHRDLKSSVVIDPKVYKNAELFLAMKADAQFDRRNEKIKKALLNIPQQKFIEEALKKLPK